MSAMPAMWMDYWSLGLIKIRLSVCITALHRPTQPPGFRLLVEELVVSQHIEEPVVQPSHCRSQAHNSQSSLTDT